MANQRAPRRATGAPGVKILITSVSLAATVAGWGMLAKNAADENAAAAAAQVAAVNAPAVSAPLTVNAAAAARPAAAAPTLRRVQAVVPQFSFFRTRSSR